MYAHAESMVLPLCERKRRDVSTLWQKGESEKKRHTADRAALSYGRTVVLAHVLVVQVVVFE